MKPDALNRDAVRELDRRAIEEYGVPALLLMENAGRACATEAQAMLASGSASSEATIVLAGPGNNGGDGFVIARTLWNRGHAVELWVLGSADKLVSGSPEVRTNRDLWRRLGRAIGFLENEVHVTALGERLARAALIVDALFGTGLTGELRPLASALVRAVNAAGRPVLAVDLPSGLDADTGAVLGAAIRADLTVTFVADKIGLHAGEGPARSGRVVIAEIGIPRGLLEGS